LRCKNKTISKSIPESLSIEVWHCCLPTQWKLNFLDKKLVGMDVKGNPFQQSHLRFFERYSKSPSSCTPASWSILSLVIFLNVSVLKHFALSLGNFKVSPSTTFVPCEIWYATRLIFKSQLNWFFYICVIINRIYLNIYHSCVPSKINIYYSYMFVSISCSWEYFKSKI